MTDNERISLAGTSLTETETLLDELGIGPAYARRVLLWIHRRRIRSFTQINDIPKKTISILAEQFETGYRQAVSSLTSADGSEKYLFRNSRGLEYESVYIPDAKRHTVCVSVQSGCRMGCRFCATGLSGWKGNLSPAEIISQVISIPYEATHVVMMGMGEPGDNPDAVIKACTIMTAEWGLAIGKNRVTVSTVGVTPFVMRLIRETECNITLSLYSPFPGERMEIIPIEGRWPFNDTVSLVRKTRLRRGRRISIAYVMISGKNDTDRHLGELKRLLSGSGIKVNLLSYHPVAEGDYQSSDAETMMKFKHSLVTSGIEATVRRSRGGDIEAACGMLAARSNNDHFTEPIQ